MSSAYLPRHPAVAYLFLVRSMRVRLAIVAAAVVFTAALVLSGWPREIYIRYRAARLAAQIERYHGAHGKYPVSLLEIAGAPVNGPIYYERDLESPEAYYLWFGTGVGTVSQYDSKTRTWHGPK